MSNDIILQTHELKREYEQGGQTLSVLQNANVEIKAGEIVALVGPSGSGKSTFLQSVGLLDTPTSGHIFIGGEAIESRNEQERTLMRRQYIGFVYQFHYLLPEFTALENVVIPQMIAGVKRDEAEEKARGLLTSMKMDHRFEHRPATMSGGEQQRVAIARALANEPKLLLADEPTGNLDPETSEIVFDHLINTVRDKGVGAIIATHNMQIAERMDRILELKNGRILSY